MSCSPFWTWTYTENLGYELDVYIPHTLDTQVRCWDGHLRHFRQIGFGTPVYIRSLEVNTIILVNYFCISFTPLIDFISIFEKQFTAYN